MIEKEEISTILRRTEEVLRTAYCGLEMMRSPRSNTKNIGLRNVLIFSRCVTFSIQTLRGKVDGFEAWYENHQEKMKSDPIFSFFRDARNSLEKEGKLEVSVSANIKGIGPEELQALYADRPPNAVSLFIGDQLGGSGWIVMLPSGEEARYYIDIPENVAVIEQVFSGKLAEKYLTGAGRSTVELAEYILERLSEIVDDAERFFLQKPSAQVVNGKRLPPFLRIIK